MAEKEFLKRVDDYIAVANEQIAQGHTLGEVSSTFMYGTARFNAWVAASEFESAEDMKKEKAEIVEYFVKNIERF